MRQSNLLEEWMLIVVPVIRELATLLEREQIVDRWRRWTGADENT
jgi:hypothetical protein